jgi:hypothetical protein
MLHDKMGKSMKTSAFIAKVSIVFAAVTFSSFLMFHTFGYDPKIPAITMRSKLWSDFGSHIPLIRSFSYGNNLNRLLHAVAPEYPGFPGEPIRYHFGFYAFAGILEKLGLRLDWAINIPSILGLSLLIFMIYDISADLFKSKATGILAVVFFLFNGSFSILTFIKTHPLNLDFFRSVITNSRFPTFGPWDGGVVTAFWNLNIYTNQRHLGLSFALVMLLIALAIKPKLPGHWGQTILKAILISVIMDLLLFVNLPAAAIAGLFLLWFFGVVPTSRIPLVIAGALSIPVFLFMEHVSAPAVNLVFKPGYLSHPPLNFINLSWFWLANLGLHTFLIPIGWILAPKNVKKLFIIPLLILFIVPNLYQFSPDMINNHKFFNFFLIIGNMFSGYALICQFRLICRIRQIWIRPVLYLIPFMLFIGLTASGVVDYFAVINDNDGKMNDIAANPDATWILNHTKPDAVFLNTTWFYHPASMAGRSIFSGYPYFTWSYGYNKDKREDIARSIYEARDKITACRIAYENNISYVETNGLKGEYVSPNITLWQTAFVPAYRNESFIIYDMNMDCTK